MQNRNDLTHENDQTNAVVDKLGRESQFSRVFITGASRGLGLALATALRKQGATVVGLARDAEKLTRTLDAIGAHALAGDVATDDPEGLVARATSLAGGPFDLFIHAASSLGPLRDAADPMPRMTDLAGDDLAQVFAVNAIGPAGIIRALHRSMRRKGGTVVVISSDAAEAAYPGWGAYGASKLALDHLMRVWTEEEKGLRFLSIEPGEMDTEMHAAALPSADPSTLQSPTDVAARILSQLETDHAQVLEVR